MASGLEVKQWLKDDFEFYSRNCLSIRSKEGGIIKLILNDAQKYIHTRIEEQKKSTGKVRAIIVKGRQQGASTYIQARFIWKLTHRMGARAFILTHDDDATQNIFAMGKRYYDNLPKFMAPEIGASNAKELIFNRLDSGYKVGTAGNKAVGRSQTNQYFHGSEVAFWANAGDHVKGVLQTIPDIAETEIIYESTGNGLGNFFHNQWKDAELGLSEFIAIFVPWFWQNEYQKELPPEFALSKNDISIKNQYSLTDEQIYWRRCKIQSLGVSGINGEAAFKQEYPMNAAEAFQTTGKDGLITSPCVMRARNNHVNAIGPLIVGVDPSRGGDRFSMIKRCGRKAYDNQSWVGAEVDTLGKAVSKCVKVLDLHCPIANKKPEMMFVDAGGGAELVDRLHELGYEKRVKAIAFGSSPINAELYLNKRGEMWGLCNQWLIDENTDVEIPDDDLLHADLCASPFDRDAKDRIVLWKKAKIKSEYGFSPDNGDALALTFAERVRSDARKIKKRTRNWRVA